MRRTGGRPPAEYEQAWRDGMLGRVPARGPGSRPRRPPEGGGHGRRSLPRRAAPAPAGAPPRTRPSSEMAWQVRTGAAAGGHLLAGRGTGATEPPPRSRAPPASQAMTLRVTLALPGEPAAQSGCPTRRCPSSPRRGPGGRARHQAGQLDSAAGQMFDKTKAENDQTVVPPGGGTVEDNGHPDQSIWGESSLHQTGVSIALFVLTWSSTMACSRCSTSVNWAWWLPGTTPIRRSRRRWCQRREGSEYTHVLGMARPPRAGLADHLGVLSSIYRGSTSADPIHEDPRVAAHGNGPPDHLRRAV